jgi:hypothetical protein
MKVYYQVKIKNSVFPWLDCYPILWPKKLERWKAKLVAHQPACYVSSLGSNQDISKYTKWATYSKQRRGQQTLAHHKKYTKKNIPGPDSWQCIFYTFGSVPDGILPGSGGFLNAVRVRIHVTVFFYLRIRAGRYFARVRQVLECCGGVHHRRASGGPTTAAAAAAVAWGLVVFTILNKRREYVKKVSKRKL